MLSLWGVSWKNLQNLHWIKTDTSSVRILPRILRSIVQLLFVHTWAKPEGAKRKRTGIMRTNHSEVRPRKTSSIYTTKCRHLGLGSLLSPIAELWNFRHEVVRPTKTLQILSMSANWLWPRFLPFGLPHGSQRGPSCRPSNDEIA